MEDELQDGGQATATVDWQSDPDFYALPMPEKHKALLELDSDYKALPGSEQVKALNTIHYGEDKQTPDAGFGGAVKRGLPGLFKTKDEPLAADPFEEPKATTAAKPWGLGETLKHGWQAGKEISPLLAPATAAAYAAAPAVGIDPQATEERAKAGDASGIYGQVAVAAGSSLAPEAIGAAAKIAKAGGRAYDRFREPGRIASAREGLVKSLDTPPGKRGERAAKMKEDVHAATADLAAIEKDTPSKVTFMLKRGKGADSFHELAEKIDARQDAMWEEGHSPGIERHAEAPIDHNAVRSAGERVLSNREAIENAPQEGVAARAWLDSVAQERGLKSADNLIREINADMRNKASANQPYSELQTRVRKEVVSELRKEVERVLDKSGENGVKEVNRRWGALDNIKSRLQERAVAEARTEAKQGPMPEWAKMYTFLHPDAVGIGVGIGLNAAKMLKPNQSSRLTGAMRDLGRTSLEAPYAAAPPEGWGTPPAGLLTDSHPAVEAPYRMQDESGTLSREEQQGRWTTPRGLLEQYPEERPERLLGAPPAELPINRTAPDDSAAIAVEPATHTERGKRGKMQRVYEGTAKQRVVGQTADGGPIYEDVPPAERSEQAISHEPIDKVRATRGAKDKGVKGGAPERRSSIRDVQGPDLMRTARAQQLRSLLDDPTLPDSDRAIIEAQLDDLKAHPFERHEGGDINSMKKQKTVSREEAEKTTEKRKEGRKKRFQGAS